MVSIADFKKLALSFHGATEAPHFERSAFKVKKIFATLDEKNKRACLMLSSVDQSVFSAFDPKIIYPVPNKWGNQGATYFELNAVRKDMLKDALSQAYNRCIEKKPKIKKTLVAIFFFLSAAFYAQDGKIDTIIGNDGKKYVNRTIEYPGGLTALYKDISANYIFPKKAKQDNVHGKILLEFTIDTLGRVISPKIIEGVRSDVDSAAIQMCKKLKRFKPALMDGMKVPQRMNIPMNL